MRDNHAETRVPARLMRLWQKRSLTWCTARAHDGSCSGPNEIFFGGSLASVSERTFNEIVGEVQTRDIEKSQLEWPRQTP